MKSKCLLIAPGILALAKDVGIKFEFDVPRGILSLASFLNIKGIRTEVIAVDHYIPDNKHFSDFSEISGKIKKRIKEILTGNDIKVIGIGFVYTIQFELVKMIAKLCKEIAPGIKIVVGGSHPTFLPERTLEEIPEIDIIVRGEGEWTLAALISNIENKSSPANVRGITFKGKNKKSLSTKDRKLGNINEIAPIDYSLLPEGFISNKKATIVSSRGCQYRKCTFCIEGRFWGNQFRKQGDEYILSEMRQLKEVYNAVVNFGDNMFDLRNGRIPSLFDKLKQLRKPDDPVRPLFILARLDHVSEEGLKKSREAGVTDISFGIESGSEKVNKMMGKGIAKDTIISSCKMAKNVGLNVWGFFIIGLPGDNVHEHRKTYDLLEYLLDNKLMDSAVITKFIPYPGTPIYQNKERFGVEILSYDWSKWARFTTDYHVIQLKEFSSEEIHSCWLKTLALNKEKMSNVARAMLGFFRNFDLENLRK